VSYSLEPPGIRYRQRKNEIPVLIGSTGMQLEWFLCLQFQVWLTKTPALRIAWLRWKVSWIAFHCPLLDPVVYQLYLPIR
jgi:hypothetical protein